MRRHKRPQAASAAPTIVYGANPVLELLASAPQSVEQLWVAGEADAARVRAAAAEAGIAVERADRATLDRLSGGGHHQGVAAQTRPFAYADFEDILDAGASLLVALDGLTDPQNLGAIVRSAEVLGAGGLVLPRDRSVGVTAAVVRASAGATVHLPIAQVVNLVRALESAKAHGYWTVALALDGSSTFQQLPELERALLVIGSEGKGARPLVLEACDFRVRIPQAGRVGSLNASVAAAIGLYALGERARAADRKSRPR
ncbi:MAG TPA: 23S rRNA (guanosine(2251)-2'-O)-methyltransferase RlmB [Candidatus Binatia bacterium]|jgi:23S rRNA (guanosine2251-2'-O)-methyltransferase